MNKDKIKEEWEIKLKSMLWDIGHTTEDAQNIIDFFSQTISEAISQHNELLIKKIEEMLVPDEITASSNPRWVYNKSKKDIINLIKDSK